MIYEIPLVLVSSGSSEGALQLLDGDIVAVGSESWFKWLRENSSFRFESGFAGEHSFTARKHERDAGDFWYAYRKIAGKLKNAYLGKTEKLDVSKLLAVASKLSEPPKQNGGDRRSEDFSFNNVKTDNYQVGNNQTQELEVVRWNVYESVEEYSSKERKKVWGDWKLVFSSKTEFEADDCIKRRKDHNHQMNSMNDYGVVRIQLEKRLERILPADTKAQCITLEVMQQKEGELATLAQENEQLKLQLQELQDQVDHLKAEHENRTSVLVAAMKNVRSNAAGKLIQAVKELYPETKVKK